MFSSEFVTIKPPATEVRVMTDDRLTLLSEYFYPESSSTSQLLTQLASGLSEDFDVTCITALPNYHSEDRRTEVPRREIHEGTEISRVRSTRFDKDALPKRVVNWLTYTLSSTVELLRTPSDVVLVVSNPPTIPAAAWLRKRLRGTPYVYLVHDLYPDIAVELGLIEDGSLLEGLWRRVNGRILGDADRVVVLGDSMREAVLSRYPAVEASQVVVIHNWEDESFIEPMPKADNGFAREHDTVGTFTIVYSGNVGRFHELETTIDAVGRLEDRGRDVRFLVIGEGARKSDLREYVDDNDIDAVEFLPFQPVDRLPESLTCGDVSLVGIKDEMGGLCVSSKLYSSLAAGRPILAVVGEDDEVATVVRDCECGVHVDPGDVDGCIETIERWMDNPRTREEQGRSARRCLEERFTFEASRRQYREVLRTVADGRP
jgi:glycosyltransferase involved in cell wall biosynthesis